MVFAPPRCARRDGEQNSAYSASDRAFFNAAISEVIIADNGSTDDPAAAGLIGDKPNFAISRGFAYRLRVLICLGGLE